jgi:hypothetical protein
MGLPLSVEINLFVEEYKSRSGIWIIRTVVFLLLIAVLAVGVLDAFQAGQAQGYALGAAGGP